MSKLKSLGKYIEISEQLAIRASEKGNAPVGAIIIDTDGKEISRAQESGTSQEDITCHAEMEAIRKARKKIGKDLSQCTLVSTHEPCVMCGYAIRFHKIGTVVFKHNVSHLGSISSHMNILMTNQVPDHWGKPPNIIQFKK